MFLHDEPAFMWKKEKKTQIIRERKPTDASLT
jgi:hypothetical protein